MKDGRRVLFISNGHGEDLIASRLIDRLAAAEPSWAFTALPVVGTGAVYRAMNVPLLAAGRDLPSGGFLRHGPRNLLADLRSGLLALTRRQIRALRRAGKETDLAVCVGDCYLLLLAGPSLRRPIVFLPTAKSDYIRPHLPAEIWLMRRYCLKIFPRDGLTAASLAAKGLPAEFLGNVMMDALDYLGPDLKSGGEAWTIGILPGSRYDAYLNMQDIARVALAMGGRAAGRPMRYLAALAGGLSFAVLAEHLAPLGWTARLPDPEEAGRGIVGELRHDGGDSVRLTIVQGRFADVIAASDLAIGLAGTANEQAAGLGKPVVAFAGRGSQFTAGFLRAQKRLLGEALAVVERDPAAAAREILAILADPPRREAMAAAGRARMGPPGGAARIAAEIRRLALAAPG